MTKSWFCYNCSVINDDDICPHCDYSMGQWECDDCLAINDEDHINCSCNKPIETYWVCPRCLRTMNLEPKDSTCDDCLCSRPASYDEFISEFKRYRLVEKLPFIDGIVVKANIIKANIIKANIIKSNCHSIDYSMKNIVGKMVDYYDSNEATTPSFTGKIVSIFRSGYDHVGITLVNSIKQVEKCDFDGNDTYFTDYMMIHPNVTWPQLKLLFIPYYTEDVGSSLYALPLEILYHIVKFLGF